MDNKRRYQYIAPQMCSRFHQKHKNRSGREVKCLAKSSHAL